MNRRVANDTRPSISLRVNSSSVTDESSVRIPVDVRRFPWIRRLAADYAYDFGAVAPFFSGDPSDRTAFVLALAAPTALFAVLNTWYLYRGSRRLVPGA